MPKVHHIKSRKDYPRFGIAKGVLHYYWVLKTGPRTSQEFRSMTPPRRSQLTTSEFLSTIYDIEDRLADLSDLDDIKSELETLGEEQQSRLENMPEGLQQGSTGQMLESRATGCADAANEIDSIIGERDSLGFELNADGELTPDEGNELPDDAQEQYDQLVEQVHGLSISYE